MLLTDRFGCVAGATAYELVPPEYRPCHISTGALKMVASRASDGPFWRRRYVHPKF
jgi:hypothetical protein